MSLWYRRAGVGSILTWDGVTHSVPRASLMTGRYAHNTGLTFAIYAGSRAGLPANIPTMPELLRQAGYSTHMVGKWHLGFSKWSQTPVGRGFQSHVGGFHGIVESWTKNLWRNPVTFEGKDWGRYQEDGSFTHFQAERSTGEV